MSNGSDGGLVMSNGSDRGLVMSNGSDGGLVMSNGSDGGTVMPAVIKLLCTLCQNGAALADRSIRLPDSSLHAFI
jgi:hypothetical protein